MTSYCSDKDLLLLARYLVGALSPRQTARLESRLDTDPTLKEALLQLKRTRSLLSACPEKKVPHNFTIKAGQTALRQEPRLFPFFRIATVASSLLFAAVVGMKLLTTNQAGELPSMMDMAAISQESVIAENAAPKSAPSANETVTTTPDARTAAGAGMLTGPSPSQEIPDEELLYEAEYVPDREAFPWNNITWFLGTICLVLALIAIYIYFQERV